MSRARLLCGLLPCLLGGVSPARAEPSPAALRRAIEPIVSRPQLASAFCGIEVRSLSSGRVLYARDAERAFRPASTLKLVTTAAALDVLGPDLRFRTTLESAGRQDGLGRILGDVYLVGRGDPSLSSRFGPGRPRAALEALADALVALGVRGIEGRLIGHEGAFVGERRGHDWTWEDLVWGYGAEVSALSWNDNALELLLRPGERPGDPALLEVSPASDLTSVVATAVTAEAGTAEDVRLEKDSASGRIRLSGRLAAGGKWSGRVAVGDPARYAVTALASALEARGIAVRGGVLTAATPLPPSLRVLAAHEGATLAEIVHVVNKESANLQAELLLRQLGLRVKGEGSMEQGRQTLIEAMARLGVPTAGWVLADGCGLARTNLVTPRGLAALLVAMDRHAAAALFRDSLPIAGVDGTLERRLCGTPAERRIVAKTGQLAQTHALAGYATSLRGERVAFAILVNNHAGPAAEAQAAIDAIAQALVAR